MRISVTLLALPSQAEILCKGPVTWEYSAIRPAQTPFATGWYKPPSLGLPFGAFSRKIEIFS